MSLKSESMLKFNKILNNAENIRNVCILAHVDHGKTTIADSLLATNGLLSRRLAGQVRYLDDRRDEQERGITMKSSAVSLYYTIPNRSNGDVLLNLIDTPGHIDFSTEVAAAVRICDGALIIVDTIEGVCVQTRDAIKQAYDEHVKMILVVNKVDRLIVELRKSIEEIFQNILRIIEDCNATIAELCRYDIENDKQEEEFLFSPDKGNVIFASGLDGWGVTTRQISQTFLEVLVDENEESLNEKMWNFDYYVDSTTKRVVSGAIDKKKENLFIQLFLKTIYHVYYTFIIRMERNKVDVILQKLKITNVTREMYHNDPRIQVKAILQAWNPLAATIMLQCKDVISSPVDVSLRRLRYLVCGNYFYEFTDLQACTEKMITNLKNCKSSDVSTVVYISKMFSVSKKNLSQNKPKVFIPSVRPRTIPKTEKQGELDQKCDAKEGDSVSTEKIEKDKKVEEENVDEKDLPSNTNDNAIIALARIYSGTLKKDQEIYFLTSSYQPPKLLESLEQFLSKTDTVKKVVIRELYMLLGRELVLVDSIQAGNICGIGGLDSVIIRTGTLSSTLDVLPIVDRSGMEPIVRNTIEPVNPKFLPKLREGLKLLMQSDSCIQVLMQETGEHVLVSAGDVHLAKCLEDLTSRFIDFKVNVSKPMVSLRETVISVTKKLDDPFSCVDVNLTDFGFNLQIVIVPLPDKISEIIRINYYLLRSIEEHQQTICLDKLLEDDKTSDITLTEKISHSQHSRLLISKIRHIISVFNSFDELWPGMWNKIWSVGNMSDSVNILFNNTSDYKRNIFTSINEKDVRSSLDHCIVNGFEMFCRAGPICGEPVVNCAVFVNDYHLENDSAKKDMESKLQIIANIPVGIKTGLREAFEKQQQRLMEPIFTTDIQVNTNILGKVYSVINKRHGKVLDAVGMDEQEKTFLVKAQIPVIESDGFANEIRKTTSGQANPNLRFSHYEIIDGDPYHESISDDEDDSINREAEIRAHNLMNEVRRRKGLFVDDQVIQHAEKQRTLNKKK